MEDPLNQIQLIPPQRQSLSVGSTTGLNQQHNRYPQVRWCRFKDPLFVFHSEHSLGWPLLALIEMLHTRSWILADILSLERELEETLYVNKHVQCARLGESEPARRGIEIHQVLATYINHLV